jgi:5-methylcytosine-specific restriction endonuclease McrA
MTGVAIPEPENEVALRLASVVAHLVQRDRGGAQRELQPLVGVTIATQPIVKLPTNELGKWPVGSGHLTRSPPQQTIAMVYVRDAFICRYCRRFTIPTQILRLISAAFPSEFPFHPNWARDIAPRPYWDISTSVDHVHAVATGGDVQDPTNLATACARCQYQKNSRPLEALGWVLQAPPQVSGWGGLVSDYEALWEATGRPDERHHVSWVRAFGTAAEEARTAASS